MSVQRISSFKTFTELKGQQTAAKLHEEGKAKRAEIVSKIGAALEELGVTSMKELDEEKRTALIARIFEDEAEDIEKEIVAMGKPEQHSEKEGEKVEADLEEGNAYVYAAAKAKAEGKNEFEFDGKKHKVTLKKDTGLKESVLIITEGTRGQFGKIDKNGEIVSVYTHYDSYPENMLPIIKKTFKNGKNVDTVISKGDNSGLDTDINKINFYGDANSLKPSKGTIKDIKKYINTAKNNAGAEFVYLFDERDGKWYMADTYADKELKPAFESVEINEARSINKIQSEWTKVTAEMAAKAKDWKAAEGDAKASLLDELKALTAKKKSLEAELDAAISDKDKDLELVVSESVEVSEEKETALFSTKGDKLVTFGRDLKAGEILVISVKDRANASFATANDLKKPEHKRFGVMFGVIPISKFVQMFGKEPKAGMIVKAVKESFEITEEEINSDEQFTEYATTVLKDAFKDEFDEAKAKEVIDGILKKCDGDYGAAVGMLTSSLG